MNVKRVAHVCNTALSYKILVDKLDLLQKEGYCIDLISAEEGYDKELMSNYNFSTKFINMNRNISLKKDIISIIEMYKLFKKEQYDIVHTHTAKAGVIGRIAAKLAKIPVVIHTSHGLPFYEGQPAKQYWTYRMLEKVGSLFCDVICSQNKEDMDKIKQYAPRKKVFYEGNGVDIEKLEDRRKNIKTEDLTRIKTELAINDEAKIIFVGARFEPVKNHLLLLDALKELKEEYYDNFVCLLAGKGSLESTIQKKIKELKLEDNVKMIGHQTDIYPYIELADIVSLTSEKEGIPRILMESMAFSKVVVATDVLGTRELVINNETGYLIPYNNPSLFARGLFDVLDNDERAKVFSNSARALVEKEFTEKIVVNRLNELYRSLMK